MQGKAAGDSGVALPFMWPTWFEGEPQWHLEDFSAYCRDGFQRNAIIYSALMYKYRAITSAPLTAYTGTREEPERLPEDHPLQRLCRRPNGYQSGAAFSGLSMVYLNLAGNSYVVPFPLGAKGEAIEALVPLRPDRVFVVPENQKSIGYIYVPTEGDLDNAVPFLLEDMLHVKLPNPLDPLEGMGEGLSPVAAMATSGDVDNEITRYLKLFFERGAMPPGALSYDVAMSPKQMAAARQRWEEIYGGVDNWAKIAVLDQKGKYQRLGLTFDEMGFGEIDARTEPRMAMVFGVPLILLETRVALTASTYSNKAEARRMFWDDTFIAELAWYESEWNDAFIDTGYFLAHDLSGVPALMPDPKDVTAAMAEAFSRGGITRNQYLAALHLDPAAKGDGEVYLLPLAVQVVPVGKTVELDATEKAPVPEAFGGPPQGDGDEDGGDTGDEGDEDNGDDDEGRPEQKSMSMPAIVTGRNHWPLEVKAQYWHLMDETAKSYERAMMAATGDALHENADATLGLLAACTSDQDGIDWTAMNAEVQAYYAGPEAPAIAVWSRLALPVLREVMVARAEYDANLFGMAAAPVKAGFDVEDFLASYFATYRITYADAITDTSRAAIRGMLATGATEGIGATEMTHRLGAVFTMWADNVGHPDTAWAQGRLSYYRRELIARTELVGASNLAGLEILRYYGVGAKEWLTALDGRERLAHASANGQVRPVEVEFDVGGEKLRYPGDPRGSPGNVINCRCTTLPVLRI